MKEVWITFVKCVWIIYIILLLSNKLRDVHDYLYTLPDVFKLGKLVISPDPVGKFYWKVAGYRMTDTVVG